MEDEYKFEICILSNFRVKAFGFLQVKLIWNVVSSSFGFLNPKGANMPLFISMILPPLHLTITVPECLDGLFGHGHLLGQ